MSCFMALRILRCSTIRLHNYQKIKALETNMVLFYMATFISHFTTYQPFN